MRYHKFLIWFWLWAMAAVFLAAGIGGIARAINMWQTSYGPSDLLPRPLAGIPPYHISLCFWTGVADIAMAVWLIIQRFWLASLKASAMISLPITHLLLLGTRMLRILPLNAPVMAEIVLVMIALAVLAISLILHFRYYRKRIH